MSRSLCLLGLVAFVAAGCGGGGGAKPSRSGTDRPARTVKAGPALRRCLRSHVEDGARVVRPVPGRDGFYPEAPPALTISVPDAGGDGTPSRAEIVVAASAAEADRLYAQLQRNLRADHPSHPVDAIDRAGRLVKYEARRSGVNLGTVSVTEWMSLCQDRAAD